MNEPSTIAEILSNTRTIAVVGLTNREGRASLGVSRFMQSQGYLIIPVNRPSTASSAKKLGPISTPPSLLTRKSTS
jgi:predicted CoA-binding protein